MEIAPRLAVWPGLCLTVVVYCLNMVGDAVRDLLDPRLRGGRGRRGEPARGPGPLLPALAGSAPNRRQVRRRGRRPPERQRTSWQRPSRNGAESDRHSGPACAAHGSAPNRVWPADPTHSPGPLPTPLAGSAPNCVCRTEPARRPRPLPVPLAGSAQNCRRARRGDRRPPIDVQIHAVDAFQFQGGVIRQSGHRRASQYRLTKPYGSDPPRPWSCQLRCAAGYPRDRVSGTNRSAGATACGITPWSTLNRMKVSGVLRELSKP